MVADSKLEASSKQGVATARERGNCVDAVCNESPSNWSWSCSSWALPHVPLLVKVDLLLHHACWLREHMP